MDAQTLVPWIIVAVVAIVGLVVLLRGRKLAGVPTLDAGAAPQTGPMVVHGEIAALGATVLAPLSGTEVVYAEAFAEVTTHERNSSGSGTTRRTHTRDLGKVTSRFVLRSAAGDTEVDGNDIRALSNIPKVTVQRQQLGGTAGALLQTVASNLGSGREDLFERRIALGDRVWVRGDEIAQTDATGRLTGKLRVYGRPVTQAARRLTIGGALLLVAAVVIAVIVAIN